MSSAIYVGPGMQAFTNYVSVSEERAPIDCDVLPPSDPNITNRQAEELEPLPFSLLNTTKTTDTVQQQTLSETNTFHLQTISEGTPSCWLRNSSSHCNHPSRNLQPTSLVPNTYENCPDKNLNNNLVPPDTSASVQDMVTSTDKGHTRGTEQHSHALNQCYNQGHPKKREQTRSLFADDSLGVSDPGYDSLNSTLMGTELPLTENERVHCYLKEGSYSTSTARAEELRVRFPLTNEYQVSQRKASIGDRTACIRPFTSTLRDSFGTRCSQNLAQSAPKKYHGHPRVSTEQPEEKSSLPTKEAHCRTTEVFNRNQGEVVQEYSEDRTDKRERCGTRLTARHDFSSLKGTTNKSVNRTTEFGKGNYLQKFSSPLSFPPLGLKQTPSLFPYPYLSKLTEAYSSTKFPLTPNLTLSSEPQPSNPMLISPLLAQSLTSVALTSSSSRSCANYGQMSLCPGLFGSVQSNCDETCNEVLESLATTPTAVGNSFPTPNGVGQIGLNPRHSSDIALDLVKGAGEAFASYVSAADKQSHQFPIFSNGISQLGLPNNDAPCLSAVQQQFLLDRKSYSFTGPNNNCSCTPYETRTYDDCSLMENPDPGMYLFHTYGLGNNGAPQNPPSSQLSNSGYGAPRFTSECGVWNSQPDGEEACGLPHQGTLASTTRELVFRNLVETAQQHQTFHTSSLSVPCPVAAPFLLDGGNCNLDFTSLGYPLRKPTVQNVEFKSYGIESLGPDIIPTTRDSVCTYSHYEPMTSKELVHPNAPSIDSTPADLGERNHEEETDSQARAEQAAAIAAAAAAAVAFHREVNQQRQEHETRENYLNQFSFPKAERNPMSDQADCFHSHHMSNEYGCVAMNSGESTQISVTQSLSERNPKEVIKSTGTNIIHLAKRLVHSSGILSAESDKCPAFQNIQSMEAAEDPIHDFNQERDDSATAAKVCNNPSALILPASPECIWPSVSENSSKKDLLDPVNPSNLNFTGRNHEYKSEEEDIIPQVMIIAQVGAAHQLTSLKHHSQNDKILATTNSRASDTTHTNGDCSSGFENIPLDDSVETSLPQMPSPVRENPKRTNTGSQQLVTLIPPDDTTSSKLGHLSTPAHSTNSYDTGQAANSMETFPVKVSNSIQFRANQ
ncbi:unnamed protein product [Calicophoron daubneyi]|uniref:Uncharacterized protein n=1 Tax=Calicophoron daubneyi TaxID=300641 RepID=A0AAV2TUZ0_CALDB